MTTVVNGWASAPTTILEHLVEPLLSFLSYIAYDGIAASSILCCGFRHIISGLGLWLCLPHPARRFGEVGCLTTCQ